MALAGVTGGLAATQMNSWFAAGRPRHGRAGLEGACLAQLVGNSFEA